jgi:type IV secretory pathway VirD2 relaxase
MERVPRLRNALLARIMRLGTKSSRAPGRSRGMFSVRDVPAPRAFSRRCVVKARYVAMNARGARAAALHLSYIEREGVEQDGSAGRIYGPADTTDVREALSSPLESEKRQFRFIVSPEDGVDVDLTAFTRRLMSQMEVDLGRKLVWGSVNHWNTDNPHVHIVVRGLDADGHDLTIDGRYIAEGLRGRAQSILTDELGLRTELHVRDQLAREVSQERFTSLDRTLQGCMGSENTLLETWFPSKDRVATARLVARIARLER